MFGWGLAELMGHREVVVFAVILAGKEPSRGCSLICQPLSRAPASCQLWPALQRSFLFSSQMG